MNYLPPLASHDKVFRENQYQRKFVFPEGYLDGKTIFCDLWVKDSQVGQRIELTAENDSITVTINSDKVRSLPRGIDYYIVVGNYYLFGVKLDVMVGFGTQDMGETIVNITEGEVTFVQIEGAAVVAGLVQVAVAEAMQQFIDSFPEA